MKTITLIVRQTEISKLFPEGLQLRLTEDACTIDAVKAFDEETNRRACKFPVKGFKSLLHMVYHPYEHRFYEQVAIQAHVRSKPFLNVRENPEMPLPDEVTIILIPEGGCTTDWEQPV